MTFVRNAFVVLVFGALFLSTKGQCDDSDFEFRESYSPEEVPVCFMLYEQLEQALVNEHLNLYKMRHVFFPNANADPTVVVITYDMTFSNISLERCIGVNNSNENNTIMQNETDTAAVRVLARITWTSSLAFSVLHPQVIDWLLPTLIYLLGPIRGSYFNFGDSSADLLLSLNVPFLPCNPLRNQVLGALNDLTTKVSTE